MHVSRLRKKLGHGETETEQVKTIRGVGYQLALDRELTRSGG